MIIYFAELSHTGHGRSPNTVPLAAGYLAATTKQYFPEAEVRIFRDPQLLLEAVKITPPDILGVSVYLWSERLANFFAQKIRDISNKTVIVAGGPSIDDIDEELKAFLQLHHYYDVCIPNQGELSFLRIVEHINAHGKLVANEVIEGCARLSLDGALLRGAYTAPMIADIPSPYLGGFLDPFLSDGYVPIIQTMRGCPYSCAFCVSGTPHWSKITAFDLDRVLAEFEYVKARAKTKKMLLTDENLGILKERDIKLAEYLIKSYNESGFPAQLYYYTAKIITEHVLKIVELLSPIGQFGISFQTLDEGVRKEIKRTNIQFDQFLKYVLWAKGKKIITSTEMIFGFPGETVESYLTGLEQLLRSGVDRIYSYNLRLFNGIDLASQKNREKYHYKTKYRLPERTFGRYDGTVVTEVEEVVVGTSSFNFDDYLTIRKYGLFLELASGRGYLSELMQLMGKLGLPGEKLIRFLTQHSYDQYPKLAAIVQMYSERAKAELFDTIEQCTEAVQSLISEGKPIPEVKLNLIFTGKIMLDDDVREEFFDAIKYFVNTHGGKKHVVFFNDYLGNILNKQIVHFIKGEEVAVIANSHIPLDKIDRPDFNAEDVLLMDTTEKVAFTLHTDAINFLKNKSISSPVKDESTLQDIYMTMTLHGLLRTRKIL